MGQETLYKDFTRIVARNLEVSDANPFPVTVPGGVATNDGGGSLTTDSVDGAHVTLGATTDAEASGNGSIIAILKRLRTLLGGTLSVKEVRSTTAVRTTVNASITTVTLLGSNSNRLGATIFNDSNVSMFLALGTGGTSTNYTQEIIKKGSYEVPYNYTGPITAVWTSATGQARITELT